MKRKQIKLSQIQKGSLLYNIALNIIKTKGQYNCMLNNEKVTIKN